MKKQFWLLLGAVGLTGCVVYHPVPITDYGYTYDLNLPVVETPPPTPVVVESAGARVVADERVPEPPRSPPVYSEIPEPVRRPAGPRPIQTFILPPQTPTIIRESAGTQVQPAPSAAPAAAAPGSTVLYGGGGVFPFAVTNAATNTTSGGTNTTGGTGTNTAAAATTTATNSGFSEGATLPFVTNRFGFGTPATTLPRGSRSFTPVTPAPGSSGGTAAGASSTATPAPLNSAASSQPQSVPSSSAPPAIRPPTSSGNVGSAAPGTPH